MNIFKKAYNAWRNIFRRRRLSLHNSADNRVVWYTHISPVNMILAFISYTAIIFVIILTLVGYTSILEMLPIYRSDISKSKERMVDNILRIDSMERIIGDVMLYNDNIALIMEGKTPVVRSSQLNDSTKLNKAMILPNAADSTLRQQMTGDGEYNLKRATLNNSSVTLISPAEGEITQHFSIKGGNHSIKIEARGRESKIEACEEGTIVLSLWSPDSGHTIGIQHPKGIISVYKNMSQSLVRSGDIVNGGEVIGYSQAQREFEFELWDNGIPANPENYIIF